MHISAQSYKNNYIWFENCLYYYKLILYLMNLFTQMIEPEEISKSFILNSVEMEVKSIKITARNASGTRE